MKCFFIVCMFRRYLIFSIVFTSLLRLAFAISGVLTRKLLSTTGAVRARIGGLHERSQKRRKTCQIESHILWHRSTPAPRTPETTKFSALCLRYEETDYPSLLSPHILNVSLHAPCLLCSSEAPLFVSAHRMMWFYCLCIEISRKVARKILCTHTN